LLGITAAFVFVDQVISTRPTEMNLEKLPLSFGEWSGKSFPVDSRIKEILETDSILSVITLTVPEIVCSFRWSIIRTTRLDFTIGILQHRSRHESSGFQVDSCQPSGEGGGKEIVVNRLVLGMSVPSKVIYYFFVTGTAMTGKYSSFRWRC